MLGSVELGQLTAAFEVVAFVLQEFVAAHSVAYQLVLVVGPFAALFSAVSPSLFTFLLPSPSASLFAVLPVAQFFLLPAHPLHLVFLCLCPLLILM